MISPPELLLPASLERGAELCVRGLAFKFPGGLGAFPPADFCRTCGDCTTLTALDCGAGNGADMLTGEIPARPDHDPSCVVGARSTLRAIDAHETSASAPASVSLTPRQQSLAAQRRALAVAALPHFDAGLTQYQCARLLAVPLSALARLLALAPARGAERVDTSEKCRRLLALPIDKLAPEEPSRAPTEWDCLLANETIAAELREIYLATMRASSDYLTHGRHTGSMSLALKRLADFPIVPPELALRLRAGCRPAALLRHLRRITPEIEALVRGPKHYQLHGPTAQKDTTLRLPDGRRAKMLSGYRVCLDDMSCNQPFYSDIVEDGQVIDTILSRQGLYAIDEASQRWLGCELVARPREAYRAEDILRFIHRLMTEVGKFDSLTLEQGIWRARAIAGFTRTERGDLVEYRAERPAMSREEQANLTQGIAGIGVAIHYVHSPHAKIIEGAFNFLQPVIATFARDFQHLGAHAGEFETAAKQLRRARAGTFHAEQLRFAPIDPLSDRIALAMSWINAQPKDALGGKSPDQQWELDLALRQLPQLAPWERAAFLPECRERMLRGGAIHFPRGLYDWPFTFRAGNDFAELGDGYRVFVRFDVCDPAQGAAILNREPPGAPRNTRNFREGQFITWAPFELPGPAADVASLPAGHVAVDDYYGLGAPDPGDVELRRQKRWHRTAARLLPRPGQPAVKAGAVRDGQGNVKSTGAPVAAAVSTPHSALRTPHSDSPRLPARLRELLGETVET